MNSDRPIVWRKSSHSGGDNGDCVELAHTPSGAIRDSKNSDGPVLRGNWTQLVQAIKDGQLG